MSEYSHGLRLRALEESHAQFEARLAAWDQRLERQQFLNDAAQQRHAEALDRHQESLDRHEAEMARLVQIQEDQQRQLTAIVALQAGHEERMDHLEAILQAIKDLLDRGNGR